MTDTELATEQSGELCCLCRCPITVHNRGWRWNNSVLRFTCRSCVHSAEHLHLHQMYCAGERMNDE